MLIYAYGHGISKVDFETEVAPVIVSQ